MWALQIHDMPLRPEAHGDNMFIVMDVCVFVQIPSWQTDKQLTDIPPGAGWVHQVHPYTSCYPTSEGWSYNNTPVKLIMRLYKKLFNSIVILKDYNYGIFFFN